MFYCLLKAVRHWSVLVGHALIAIMSAMDAQRATAKLRMGHIVAVSNE